MIHDALIPYLTPLGGLATALIVLFMLKIPQAAAAAIKNFQEVIEAKDQVIADKDRLITELRVEEAEREAHIDRLEKRLRSYEGGW